MSDTHFAQVKKAYLSKDLILYIGAGLSMGAGLPGWLNIVKPLAADLKQTLPPDEFVNADHLLTVLQSYENQHGRNSLIRYFMDQLDTSAVVPTEVHHLLPRLNISLIFTTNYDHLIEDVYAQDALPLQVLREELDIPYWDNQATKLVKLCGDIKLPHSLVITKSQFNVIRDTRPRLIERLRSNIESGTVLFLGYSLQDPFFNQLWDQIGLDYSVHRRLGYALMSETNQSMEKDLHQRGIRIIKLECNGMADRNQTLALWLLKLLNGT